MGGIHEVGVKKDSAKIFFDNGATYSVCPKDWAESFTTVLCERGEAKSFVNAAALTMTAIRKLL